MEKEVALVPPNNTSNNTRWNLIIDLTLIIIDRILTRRVNLVHRRAVHITSITATFIDHHFREVVRIRPTVLLTLELPSLDLSSVKNVLYHLSPRSTVHLPRSVRTLEPTSTPEVIPNPILDQTLDQTLDLLLPTTTFTRITALRTRSIRWDPRAVSCHLRIRVRLIRGGLSLE